MKIVTVLLSLFCAIAVAAHPSEEIHAQAANSAGGVAKSADAAHRPPVKTAGPTRGCTRS